MHKYILITVLILAFLVFASITGPLIIWATVVVIKFIIFTALLGFAFFLWFRYRSQNKI